jgi:hypothetical protein
MTSPWSALDGATHPQTGKPTLYLEPSVIPALNQASDSYCQSLQTLIDDRLDDTTGYFGTKANPLALLLEKAFNSRGTVATNYCQQQLSQTQDLVKTACDAAAATQAEDSA